MARKNIKLVAVSIAAGLLTLLPPWAIGSGSSALAFQSLEHWMRSTPDSFEALHIHWLWVPRVIAFVTGDAFSALVLFRILIVAAAILLFTLAARRLFDERRAMIGAAMLFFNVTLLFLFHTFSSQLLTLFLACALLYLFTSSDARDHRLGALLFGLSLAIGFWPFILSISILTFAFNIHHTRYTLRSKETYLFFGIILVGAASYLFLEIFYFGTSHLWEAINPAYYAPRGVNRILEGIIIAVFSINALLTLGFWKKAGGIGREFQPAFLILGLFFIANTFSRDAMLHDAAIILPCLILVALDKVKQFALFSGIYFAVNLGLFVLLPSFEANPQLALANSRRTTSQDAIAFSYYETFDLFSYAQAREMATGEEEARNLLSGQPRDSTLVLLNASTDTWLDAGTLGAEFPTAHFGWYYGRPLNVVRLNGVTDTIFFKLGPAVPNLCGLFEKSFAREFIDSTLPPSIPIRESEHFQYIDCRGNEAAKRALIDQLFYLQYQGVHSR